MKDRHRRLFVRGYSRVTIKNCTMNDICYADQIEEKWLKFCL